MGSNLEMYFVSASTLDIIFRFKAEHEKIISTCRVVEESYICISYQERIQLMNYDYKLKEMVKITSIQMESHQFQASHMKDKLAVASSFTGDVFIILLSHLRHHLNHFRLAEGKSVKLLRIVGKNNLIFLMDNDYSSYLIQINDKYINKNTFEFAVNSKSDFFLVHKITGSKGKNVQFECIASNYAVSGQHIILFLFDETGGLHVLKTKAVEVNRCNVPELQNYLRSHHVKAA